MLFLFMMKKFFFIYFFLWCGYLFCQKADYKVLDSITIKTKGNTILTLSVVLNDSKRPQNTILINTIYSSIQNVEGAKYFARNGYAAVILNTRGKYLSPGIIEPFEHEAEDIHEAIDWIIKQPWSNGKVGMIGGSYLGFSQWAATKKMHPALRTIVPQAAVAAGTMDFPMKNNIFFGYSLQWLNKVTNNKMTDDKVFNDTNKWNSVFKTWYQSGKAFRKLDSISGRPNVIFQRWLDHPDYDGYWKKMIPYKDDFSRINIPVLTTTGYFDADKEGALHYLREHYKYNKNAEHYLIIGPYDHDGAQSNIKSNVRGYAIDSAARIDLYKIYLEWFGYIFNNQPKPSFLKDKINYQVMGANLWKNASSLDVFDKNKTKFYLLNINDSLYLSDKKGKRKNQFSALKVDLKDRSNADELLERKYNIVENKLYRKDNLVFKTDTFNQSFEFSGNISGILNVSLNAKDADLYFNLYEETPQGSYFLLSSYVTRLSYAGNNEVRNLLFPGKKQAIPIKSNGFVSKKIGKGSRFVLTVGVVKSPYWQINYGSGKDVSDETIEDAKEPLEIKIFGDSYIEIWAQKTE